MMLLLVGSDVCQFSICLVEWLFQHLGVNYGGIWWIVFIPFVLSSSFDSWDSTIQRTKSKQQQIHTTNKKIPKHHKHQQKHKQKYQQG